MSIKIFNLLNLVKNKFWFLQNIFQILDATLFSSFTSVSLYKLHFAHFVSHTLQQGLFMWKEKTFFLTNNNNIKNIRMRSNLVTFTNPSRTPYENNFLLLKVFLFFQLAYTCDTCKYSLFSCCCCRLSKQFFILFSNAFFCKDE